MAKIIPGNEMPDWRDSLARRGGSAGRVGEDETMETYKAWVLERGSAELGIPRMNGFYSQIHALIDAIDDAIQHGIPEGSPMAKERIDPERMPFETWSSLEVGRINRILGRIEVEASNGALNPGANVSPKSVLYLLKTARAVAIQRRAA